MTIGDEWEVEFEEALNRRKIPYKREQSKRFYGSQSSSKGKYDFTLEKACVEMKTVEKATKLSLTYRGNRPQVIFKAHQLKALRQARKQGKLAGYLIWVRDTNKKYWLEVSTIDIIIIDRGMVKSINNDILSEYAIEICNCDEWIDRYLVYNGKGENHD